MRTQTIPLPSPLQADESADVAIVGGGITGLTTAYLLAQEGLRVIVIDDGPLAGGETQKTSAHLSNVVDSGYAELEKGHGEKGARLAAESHTAAIDLIESIAMCEGIDCSFERVDGYWFSDSDSKTDLQKEYEAAARAGLAVEWLPKAPLERFDTGRTIRVPRQAQFHPLRYLAALIELLQKKNVKLYSGTHAQKIEGGRPGTIRTHDGHTITADSIIIATNSPINAPMIPHTKQAAFRSYCIALPIEKESVPAALYWDTADPYHYVRIERTQNGHDFLIVGGEDHPTGQADDGEERFQKLALWARERFDCSGDISDRWSGQILENHDGLAYIGPNPMDKPNIYIATGDCGFGLTHGTLAGMILCDRIIGKENPWSALYDPSRKSKSVDTTTKDDADDATDEDKAKQPEALLPGQGDIFHNGHKKFAVYRDPAGTLHRISAKCPHLGCTVVWNSTENSWDCPCHGSRFNCYGKVENGPSNKDLEPIDD